MKSSMLKVAVATAAMMVGGSAIAEGGGGGPLPENQTSFQVNATVPSACMVGNPVDMDFGSIKMLSGTGLTTQDSHATARFDAACTNGSTTPKFRFASLNGGGAFKMTHVESAAEAPITYELHANTAAGALITHDTPAEFAGFVVDGTVKQLTVAGVITAANKAGKTVGDYSDVVTITVGFQVAAAD